MIWHERLESAWYKLVQMFTIVCDGGIAYIRAGSQTTTWVLVQLLSRQMCKNSITHRLHSDGVLYVGNGCVRIMPQKPRGWTVFDFEPNELWEVIAALHDAHMPIFRRLDHDMDFTYDVVLAAMG